MSFTRLRNFVAPLGMTEKNVILKAKLEESPLSFYLWDSSLRYASFRMTEKNGIPTSLPLLVYAK